jgi:hypothetical protein
MDAHSESALDTGIRCVQIPVRSWIGRHHPNIPGSTVRRSTAERSNTRHRTAGATNIHLPTHTGRPGNSNIHRPTHNQGRAPEGVGRRNLAEVEEPEHKRLGDRRCKQGPRCQRHSQGRRIGRYRCTGHCRIARCSSGHLGREHSAEDIVVGTAEDTVAEDIVAGTVEDTAARTSPLPSLPRAL